MEDTSLSLLNRLQQTDAPESWRKLVSVYTPLMRAWMRKYAVPVADTDDLIQEVLLTVTRELPAFEHAGNPGAFRSWLRTILVNRLRYYWRSRDHRPQTAADSKMERQLQQLEDPASQMSALWNRQHDRHVMRQLMSLVEPNFEAKTWEAFRGVAIQGARPEDVAEKLNISVNSVFIAKSRVLSRLRQEAEGLVESSTDFSPNS